MKTYVVTQLVEMTVESVIRAANADEANDKATERTARICRSIARRYASVAFGDITDDYVPARDD